MILKKKSKKKTIEVKSLRTLATAIFKTLNNINPHCMNDILKPKVKSKARTNVLEILSIVLKS